MKFEGKFQQTHKFNRKQKFELVITYQFRNRVAFEVYNYGIQLDKLQFVRTNPVRITLPANSDIKDVCVLDDHIIILEKGHYNIVSKIDKDKFITVKTIIGKAGSQDMHCLSHHNKVILKLDYTLFAMLDGANISESIYKTLDVYYTPSMSEVNFIVQKDRVFAQVGGGYDSQLFVFDTQSTHFYISPKSLEKITQRKISIKPLYSFEKNVSPVVDPAKDEILIDFTLELDPRLKQSNSILPIVVTSPSKFVFKNLKEGEQESKIPIEKLFKNIVGPSISYKLDYLGQEVPKKGDVDPKRMMMLQQYDIESWATQSNVFQLENGAYRYEGDKIEYFGFFDNSQETLLVYQNGVDYFAKLGPEDIVRKLELGLTNDNIISIQVKTIDKILLAAVRYSGSDNIYLYTLIIDLNVWTVQQKMIIKDSKSFMF